LRHKAVCRQFLTQCGLRPLKRAVQEQLLNPLVYETAQGEFKPGDKIKVIADGDELVFKAK
jgi:ATP-dependent Clp protease ATP-binding subunit ClpB